GDVNSAGLAMNNLGVVVGGSVGGNGNPLTGSARAFVWQNGTMYDLNALVPPHSPMYLIVPFGINDAGQIVGFGFTASHELHAFLATPNTGAVASQIVEPAAQHVMRPPALPANIREMVRGWFGTRGW